MNYRVEIIQINDWLSRRTGIESGDIVEVNKETNKALYVGGNWIPKSQIAFNRLDGLDIFTQ